MNPAEEKHSGDVKRSEDVKKTTVTITKATGSKAESINQTYEIRSNSSNKINDGHYVYISTTANSNSKIVFYKDKWYITPFAELTEQQFSKLNNNNGLFAVLDCNSELKNCSSSQWYELENDDSSVEGGVKPITTSNIEMVVNPSEFSDIVPAAAVASPAASASPVAAPAAAASPPVAVTAPTESDMKKILKSTDTEYTSITDKLKTLTNAPVTSDIKKFDEELDSAKKNLKGAQDNLDAFRKAQVTAETDPTVSKENKVDVPQTVITDYNDFMKILTYATVNDGSTVAAGLKVNYANFAQTVADAFNNAVIGTSSSSTNAELKASLTSNGACIITADGINKALSPVTTSTPGVNKFLAFIKSNSLKSEADKPDAASPPHARSPSNTIIDPKLYLSVIAALAYNDILPIIQKYLETDKQAAALLQPLSPATPATPQNLPIPTLERFIEQINAIFLNNSGSNDEKYGLTALIAKKYSSQEGGGGTSSSSAKSKKNRKSHKSYHPGIGKTRKHHSHSEPKRISFVHQA